MANLIAISSSPYARNGFGTQIAVVCRGLAKRGHKVTLIAMHRPQEAATWVWEMPDGRTFQGEGGDDYSGIGAQKLYRILPHGVDPNQPQSMFGTKMLELMLQHERPDGIITLHDTQNVAFVGKVSGNMGIPWFHWLPWDNSKWEPDIAKFFMESQCRVVLMSDFTERLCKEHRFPYVAKIYHGVNTAVYKPMDKAAIREKHGFPKDKFIVGYIGQNEERKHNDMWVRGMADFVNKMEGETLGKSLQKFSRDKLSKFMVFMHTDVNEPYPAHWSYKIIDEMQKADIDEIFRHTSRMQFVQKFTDKTMAELYNIPDLLLSSTSGEGFGLMALYGNSCGTPSAVTDINTTDQLTGGGRWGWKIPLATKYEAPGGYVRGLVNDLGITNALTDAYLNPEKLKQFGVLAREDSLRYDWNIIGDQWADLVEKELSAQ